MNNSSAIVVLSSASSLTIGELWFQSIFIYVFGALFLCTAANALLLAAIRTDAQLRSRFYIMLSVLTLNRLLMSLNFGVMGVYRCLRQAGIVRTEQPRIVCYTIHIWLMVGTQLELMLILLMVIDRTIALLAPIKYLGMTRRSAWLVCVPLLIVSIGMRTIPGAFWGVRPLEMVACTTIPTAYSVVYAEFGANVDNVITGLIVLLSVILIVIVRARVRRQMDDTTVSAVAKKSLKRQLVVIPILRNQIILHLALTWTSKLLILSSTYETFRDYAPRLTYWGGNTLIIDCFANTMVVLMGNSDIRKTAVGVLHKFIRAEQNDVTPFGTM